MLKTSVFFKKIFDSQLSYDNTGQQKQFSFKQKPEHLFLGNIEALIPNLEFFFEHIRILRYERHGMYFVLCKWQYLCCYHDCCSAFNILCQPQYDVMPIKQIWRKRSNKKDETSLKNRCGFLPTDWRSNNDPTFFC